MTLSISVTELDPESTEIASVAEDIVKSQVTCSPDEKTKLKEQKAALEEGINKAQASLKEVQEKLEELTGITAATTTTTGATTTTAAPAFCKCGVKKPTRIVGGTEVAPVRQHINACSFVLSVCRRTNIPGWRLS